MDDDQLTLGCMKIPYETPERISIDKDSLKSPMDSLETMMITLLNQLKTDGNFSKVKIGKEKSDKI